MQSWYENGKGCLDKGSDCRVGYRDCLEKVRVQRKKTRKVIYDESSTILFLEIHRLTYLPLHFSTSDDQAFYDFCKFLDLENYCFDVSHYLLMMTVAICSIRWGTRVDVILVLSAIKRLKELK